MVEKVRILLEQGDVEGAVALLEQYRREGGRMDDTLFYLLGNAWRKKGNWQMAMNNYLEAVAINPESPAAQALQVVRDILAFRNPDLYNP